MVGTYRAYGEQESTKKFRRENHIQILRKKNMIETSQFIKAVIFKQVPWNLRVPQNIIRGSERNSTVNT
jgi:hypothetical protein